MASEYPHASSSAAQLALDATERRAQVEYEQEMQQAERQRKVEAQRSVLNSPEERVRHWERFHALKLPQAPNHKLLELIAAQTELTISELHEEQARRAANKSI